ncbi:recombinase family protein [Luteococcus sp. Sow4_B9]|uniref:recombinase family protein n=1 Tax=Luteococcus sp. Sow4_B9 TaxID=3438792 RepID=UPI003F99C745
MEAAIYLRKSNQPGEANRSLAVQRAECLELCEREGYRVDEDHIFEEVASGWSSHAERKAFEKLKALVEEGRVQRVVALAMDRLGRRVTAVGQLIDLCQSTGAMIHTTRDGLMDPNNPGKALQLNIMSAVAQAESSTTSARIKTDKLKRALEGGWVGGTPPYGFRAKRAGKLAKLVHRADEAQVVRLMIRMIMEEAAQAGEVARELNKRGFRTRPGKLWTTAAVQRALVQPALAGWQAYSPGADRHRKVWDRTAFRDETGEAIVVGDPYLSFEEWETLQRRMARKKVGAPREKSSRTPLLRGVLYCECGQIMYPSGTKQYPRYVCSAAAKKQCTCSISAVVDQVAIRYTSIALKSGEVLRAFEKEQQKRAKRLTAAGGKLSQQRAEAQERVKALGEALASVEVSAIPIVAKRLEEATQHLNELDAKIEEILVEPEPVSPERIMGWLFDAEPKKQREAVQAVIQKVTVAQGGRLSPQGRSRTQSTTNLGRVKIHPRFGQVFEFPDGAGVEYLQG